MKIKKYALILFILLILINIASINAADNNTDIIEHDISINEDTNIAEINEETENQIQASESNADIIEQNDIRINEDTSIGEINEETENQETLTASPSEDTLELNENEKTLSDIGPNGYDVIGPAFYTFYNTQFTLKTNTSTFDNTTKNITFDIHLEWDLYMSSSYYYNTKILVYENNTIIHTFLMSDLNPEHDPYTHDIKDISFQYTIKDRTEIKATLKNIYDDELESDIFSFEELKDITNSNLKSNSIVINGNEYSNESWTNQIKYLKKAIEEAPMNSIIQLNDVEFLNDENIRIHIDKNLTIIGNNATINGLDHGTIFEINPQATVTLINLTFTEGMTDYIIRNHGKLNITNTSFNSNMGRLISNDGDLTLENFKIENINTTYYALSFNEIDTTGNGLIHNSKTLRMINAIFNNIELHPFTINDKKINWDGIIVNDANATILDSNFTNIGYKLIYNNGLIEINNITVDNSATSTRAYYFDNMQNLNDMTSYFVYSAKEESFEGGSLYNNNQSIISNISYENMRIFNNGQLTIKSINSDSRLIINNYGNLLMENTTTQATITNNGNFTIKNTTTKASITNKGNFTIENATLTPASITNNGTMLINDTIITGNSGISNNGKMTVSYSQIINNDVGNSLIINSESGNFTIEKTLIKKNTITAGTPSSGNFYYGVIRNNGVMNVTGCVFDNNTARDWRAGWPIVRNAEGAICIYNSGRITVMYNYLLNVDYYVSDIDPTQVPYIVHTPVCFLDNKYNAPCNMNYNFFCLSPGRVVYNTAVNYYFIPSFSDYIPVKLNEDVNITLTLGLTNGNDKMDFDDWDKLLIPGLNATITTLDENGEYYNTTLLLKDYYTFNFNYTSIKGEYPIYATIMNHKNDAIVEVGKEFADMEVNYNNITYNQSDMTFHIKVTGNLTTPPTGNITFTFNKQKYNITLTDGECDFTIPTTLNPGNYTIKIVYNGDDEYFKIINKYYFSVFKIPTLVNVTAPEVKYGESGTITITLSPDTAKLFGKIYVNGIMVKDNLAIQNTITQSIKRGNGTYNITVVLDEDEYYEGCSASTIFIVSKWETSLSVDSEDIKAGENATINITISPGDVRGNAILQINNENRSIFINNTMTPITLTDLEEGTYIVTVYYPGDVKYAPSNASTRFSVSRISSKLIVSLTQNENLTGNMKIETDPINCTGEVIIFINNDQKILNLSDGTINTEIKFKRGTNYIYIKYNGDETYSVSIWNTTINIEGDPVLSIETERLESGKTGYVRINLTDTNGIPYEYTDIEIEFQNQTATITTDANGMAYFPINEKTGTYTIKAIYKNITREQTITVAENKKPTVLTVDIPTINADDDLIVYVTLTDINKNKITANITLEIEGKYYKIIVKDGIGSRNLGEFKAKQYKYTARYAGNEKLETAIKSGTFKVKKNNYKITGNKNIKQYNGATRTYKIRVLNNNQPVKNAIVTVKLNKKTLNIKTDKNGYATLKLKLKAGKYTIKATYKTKTVTNKITVKKTLITKNRKIKKGKTAIYKAKLLNKKGKPLKNKKITFKIKGKTYKAKTNKKGIAKIKIKINKGGKYKIITKYKKQKNTNTIKVK